MSTEYFHSLLMQHYCAWLAAMLSFCIIGNPHGAEAGSNPSPELARHLIEIAALAQPSPMVSIPASPFLLGSKRVEDDPTGNWAPFDDTELPQHRIWLDAYEMDRDEVSLGEYLAFLKQRKLHPPDELQKLLWHVITIHSITDKTLSRWPALYVTWAEANDLCMARNARLPTEAEWEKAARGSESSLFPWSDTTPDTTHAMFGQYHVHEIPILAAVDSHDAGMSP
ncbi:MAG: formylglycine-generating enzyme family protein [Nitrospira sp. CG24E]|nr:MAG: formylglycine-generating enzyme family protein [Nitrospira sp. CG24E]